MRNLFTHPPRLPLIAPSILSADFARMGDECAALLTNAPPGPSDPPGAADLLHLDVMDGHFVPNLTMGPDMCRALRRAFPNAFLDVHLMVTDPLPHARAFAAAGANHITFHVEVVPPASIASTAAQVRELGCTAGIAINPPTPVAAVLPHLDPFDLILVMSVNPGFSGQAFISEVLPKTATIRQRLRPDQRLEMDGGINSTNIKSVRESGCDVIVAASAVFGRPPAERRAAIAALRV